MIACMPHALFVSLRLRRLPIESGDHVSKQLSPRSHAACYILGRSNALRGAGELPPHTWLKCLN